MIYALLTSITLLIIYRFKPNFNKTSKEKYEELLLKKKLELLKLNKYKISIGSYIVIIYDGLKEVDKIDLYIKNRVSTNNGFSNIIINGKDYNYRINDFHKLDDNIKKILNLIFKQGKINAKQIEKERLINAKQIDKERLINAKQIEKERLIQEEIEYAEKIKILMHAEIKINKEVKEEFNPLFKKLERLETITKEAGDLMREAEKIRNKF